MITLLALAALAAPAYDITGFVSEYTIRQNGLRQILVSSPDTHDMALVRITAATAIVDPKGQPANWLRNRVKVGVDFSGPVAESHPVQATAKRIVILSEQFDAKGVVASISRPTGGLRFAVRDPKKNENVAVVTVVAETLIQRLRNGKRIPATAQELRNGVSVEMAYDGPVMLSYPPQGKAGYILIK